MEPPAAARSGMTPRSRRCAAHVHHDLGGARRRAPQRPLVKVGLFDPGWTTLYHWNDAAGLIDVTAAPPTPTTTTTVAPTTTTTPVHDHTGDHDDGPAATTATTTVPAPRPRSARRPRTTAPPPTPATIPSSGWAVSVGFTSISRLDGVALADRSCSQRSVDPADGVCGQNGVLPPDTTSALRRRGTTLRRGDPELRRHAAPRRQPFAGDTLEVDMTLGPDNRLAGWPQILLTSDPMVAPSYYSDNGNGTPRTPSRLHAEPGSTTCGGCRSRAGPVERVSRDDRSGAPPRTGRFPADGATMIPSTRAVRCGCTPTWLRRPFRSARVVRYDGSVAVGAHTGVGNSVNEQVTTVNGFTGPAVHRQAPRFTEVSVIPATARCGSPGLPGRSTGGVRDPAGGFPDGPARYLRGRHLDGPKVDGRPQATTRSPGTGTTSTISVMNRGRLRGGIAMPRYHGRLRPYALGCWPCRGRPGGTTTC